MAAFNPHLLGAAALVTLLLAVAALGRRLGLSADEALYLSVLLLAALVGQAARLGRHRGRPLESERVEG